MNAKPETEETPEDPRTTFREKVRRVVATQQEWTAEARRRDALAILGPLQDKKFYEGTVSEDQIAKRRARNKAARKARRSKRLSASGRK